ncbi:hypothetical protein FQR65_LT14353 [Abscondita terminalis]|nr:hypothetical protein FQR65_LT14353 [Abscondita terminalis]
MSSSSSSDCTRTCGKCYNSDEQRQKPEFSENLPPGSLVKMARKGSMTTELFVGFVKHLGKHKTQGKILSIFDGATSHLDYTIVENEAQNKDF